MKSLALAAPVALLIAASLYGQGITPPAAPQTASARHLVQVRIESAADLDRLLGLDLDLASCQALEPPVRLVDVIATDEDFARITRAGLFAEVAIRDLAAHHERELARHGAMHSQALTPPVGQGAMGGHYTLQQMTAILDTFARDYPNLCSPKLSIGQSIEGRDIWLVRISDNVGSNENEPRVWFDSVHHAREPVSMSATLAFMDWLLSNYGTDPIATTIVDEREVFFVPCVNPDGYEYNRSTNPGGGGMWRKNRRNNGNGTFGIDLNRNYATGWSAPNGGNSTSSSSDTYRGTAPFSEPETAAIEAFMTGLGTVVSCSTHTYTDVLLHPWGYQNGGPANAAEYAAMGPTFTDDSGVPFGPVSTQLYIAAGGALDHHHAVHGVSAWSPELGRSNEGGFWPVPSAQVAIVDRHLTMFRDMALAAGVNAAIESASVVEAASGNGNGVVEAGETGSVQALLRNHGLGALPLGLNVSLQSLTSGVTVINGAIQSGALPRLGTSSVAAGQLSFAVAPGFGGTAATLRLTVSGPGASASLDLEFPTRLRVIVVTDDLEADRGFTLTPNQTAATGRFERAAPQQTTNGGTVIQPGSQHTQGGIACLVTDGRAGTGAGSFDVDGGITAVQSPIFDLSHVTAAEVSLWYWYAESVGNDPFEIALSRDGGSNWSPLFSRSTSTGAWTALTLAIQAPLTDRMRLRFTAQDLQASLVEALIDDLEIRAIAEAGAVTLWSSGALGSNARLDFVGADGAAILPLVALAASAPIAIPGIAGQLLLDPSSIVTYPALPIGPDRHVALEVTIPANPALAGAALHWQALHAQGAALRLGNAVELRLN
jgi:hypothetical protein